MKPQVITELPVAGSLPELLHGQLRVPGPPPPQGHPAWGCAARGLWDIFLPLPGCQPGPAVVTAVKHLHSSTSTGFLRRQPAALRALLGLAQSCAGSEALGSQQRLSMPLAILSAAHSPHISMVSKLIFRNPAQSFPSTFWQFYTIFREKGPYPFPLNDTVN